MIYFITWHSPLSPEAPAQRIKNYLRCTCAELSLSTIGAGLPCQLLLKKQDKAVCLDNVIPDLPYKSILGHCPLSPRYRRLVFCFLSEIATLLYLLVKLTKNDIVFLYDSDISWTRVLIPIAHFKKAAIVCELCELPYGTTVQTESTRRMREKYERKILTRVDGIVAISDALAEYARMHTKPNCIITKVPILVDYAQYDLEDRSHETSIPYMFHSGTLYEQKDGILGMLEAFGKASEQLDFPVMFISTGRKECSPHSAEMDAIIRKYDLQEKVLFTGFLSETALKQYLQKASLVVINKYRNQQNTYCFSTKLGEYMAAGKAVIITRVGEAMNWLANGDNALIIEPGDNDALANAIVTLFRDNSLRTHLGEAAKRDCKQHFDYRRWTDVLNKFFLITTQPHNLKQ